VSGVGYGRRVASDGDASRAGWWKRALRGDGRPAWTALAWPLAALVLFGALVRLLGLERGVLLDQLASFAPYLAAGAGVVALASLLARRWVSAAMAGLATVVLLVCVVPRAVGSPAPAGGTPLVVMALNMRLGGADSQAVVALVRDAQVDVLALEEFTPSAQRQLLAAGLGTLLPYRESHPDSGGNGAGLFSRLPLSDGGVRAASEEGHLQAHATVTVADRSFVIESVHPVPPIDAESDPFWIAGLAGQAPADGPGPPRILAGDFNATLDHEALRRLLATGYRDAAASVGQGLTPTWPYYGIRSFVTPKITLDHVLVPAGVNVRGFRAVAIPRSDHRAIVATLALP
jgi:endonuclease/exonuclease/phosphatase (EEP) superfamily protein YafD